eukprot:CAMPEP_0115828828 /NCGR_PEP_ID=MMETSP0287-20121206/778_1 /TAXON_ID=412157 /ORGANISM="Chrysochromulina rotalis, Strain UIO044" /LENGTH=34 /DNA_ID= /DNA_START= /DNA_END= /DNA_ORIENTATION=
MIDHPIQRPESPVRTGTLRRAAQAALQAEGESMA